MYTTGSRPEQDPPPLENSWICPGLIVAIGVKLGPFLTSGWTTWNAYYGGVTLFMAFSTDLNGRDCTHDHISRSHQLARWGQGEWKTHSRGGCHHMFCEAYPHIPISRPARLLETACHIAGPVTQWDLLTLSTLEELGPQESGIPEVVYLGGLVCTIWAFGCALFGAFGCTLLIFWGSYLGHRCRNMVWIGGGGPTKAVSSTIQQQKKIILWSDIEGAQVQYCISNWGATGPQCPHRFLHLCGCALFERNKAC